MKQKYRLMILALVFVGTLLASFHHHDDMHAEEDCQVCVIQQVFSVADIPDPFVLPELILFLLVPVLSRQNFVALRPNPSYPSRAPPFFS